MEELTIYIDVLFFYNLLINFPVLWVTGVATGRKISVWRALLGSSAGALYACVVALTGFSGMLSIGIFAFASGLIIYLTFGRNERTEFFKLLLVYYLMNFMLAGGITFSGGFFRSPKGIAMMAVFSGLLLLYCFSRAYFCIIKKNMISGAKRVRFSYNGKQIALKAFLDTGNTLKEPMEQLGVVVVKASCLQEMIDISNPQACKHLRLIPCSTVTKGEGVLWGFKPDSIFCDDKPIRAVVAVSDNLQLEHYDAIVNPVILV